MKNLRELLLSADPVSELRTMIANNTLRAFEASLADLKMDIPNGFHHKDNLEHSWRVLQNAIDRENGMPDLILRAAALFHDIGKPATRKFGTRKSVTFDGHETVGASIVRKVLPKHDFTSQEVKEIALLVALHMRSHGFTEVDWTDSAVRRLINDAKNNITLERLIIIFYADGTSRNVDKLKLLHSGIDKLKTEIKRVKEKDERKALRPALNGTDVMSIFKLKEGKELGQIMKFLNSDEGIQLNKEQAIEIIKKNF